MRTKALFTNFCIEWLNPPPPNMIRVKNWPPDKLFLFANPGAEAEPLLVVPAGPARLTLPHLQAHKHQGTYITWYLMRRCARVGFSLQDLLGLPPRTYRHINIRVPILHGISEVGAHVYQIYKYMIDSDSEKEAFCTIYILYCKIFVC